MRETAGASARCGASARTAALPALAETEGQLLLLLVALRVPLGDGHGLQLQVVGPDHPVEAAQVVVAEAHDDDEGLEERLVVAERAIQDALEAVHEVVARVGREPHEHGPGEARLGDDRVLVGREGVDRGGAEEARAGADAAVEAHLEEVRLHALREGVVALGEDVGGQRRHQPADGPAGRPGRAPDRRREQEHEGRVVHQRDGGLRDDEVERVQVSLEPLVVEVHARDHDGVVEALHPQLEGEVGVRREARAQARGERAEDGHAPEPAAAG
mmetsp:Transcript_10045/g.41665  ORF Transcript_10045/g.41665 Transcript_10045/m.41665 type:complete len:272 (+) Transcript_10045:113-928(+)